MPSRGNRLSQRTLLRERLLRILAEFPGRTLGVAGDLIADQFLYGQISRVSREAPERSGGGRNGLDTLHWGVPGSLGA